MSHPKIVHPVTADSAGVTTPPLSHAAQPDDLLLDATRRITWLSLTLLLLGSFFFLLSHVFHFWVSPCPLTTYGLFPLFFLASLTMFLVARSGRLRCPVLHRYALVYQIVTAALLAGMTNVRPWPADTMLPAWSPVAVWVLVFPIVVPIRPRHTLMASIVAAAMDPLSMLLVRTIDHLAMPSASLMAMRFVPDAIAVVLGASVARMILRVGAKLAKARELGNYQLGEQLGQGGMGEVWRGQHRLLARPAAVKLIRPDVLGAGSRAGDPEAILKRFEREVQATAVLRSPHTIEVYDYGIANDGTFYYVMELLDGIDLGSLVKKFGPQPPPRVARILAQACHSLAEAHERGLVHRDIKPGNLFLCRLGRDLDFVKVLDFGLVKERARSTKEETALTKQGIATGTPAFMAPEMILGEGPIDGRADLYALGCVAYWLLTGTLVFTADTDMALLVKHAKEAPEPPSQRTELAIPPDLERLVLSCLEKDRTQRPQTAEELAAALARLDLGPAWDGTKAATWWETHLPAQSA